MELAPGTVLLGKYRVDEVLGIGGMGRVVRASHIYLQQSVAIKILLPHMADSASTVSRFLREAQSTVPLKSEHIARVQDVGTIPGNGPEAPPTPFMVMEYLDGNDLNQILRHHGPQSPEIVCDLMLQACEGLGEAHAMGIVHRDIKPSNFFITKRPDNSMLLKVLDFGISKTPVGLTELTNTQTVLGTPTYMAPEQMKTSKSADPRSDIWSMGVVMYQLLSGRPPFNGDTYAELVLKVSGDPPAPIMIALPPGLGEVILRCLEKNPLMRPQNVGELARSLAPFASDPISAAQSAARTTRILQHRTAQKGINALPLTATGGRATPTPIQPAAFTPRSWPPTSNTSGHGVGQVTHRVRSGRGWLIAGIAFLCILTGAGGFIASQMMSSDDGRPASQPSPPPTAVTTTPIDPAPPTTPVDDSADVTRPGSVTPTLPPPSSTITPAVDPAIAAQANADAAKAKAEEERLAKAEAQQAKAAAQKAKAEEARLAKLEAQQAKAEAQAAAKLEAQKAAAAKAEAQKAAAAKAAAAKAEAQKAEAQKAAAAKAKPSADKPKPKPAASKPKPDDDDDDGDLFDSRK